MSLFERKHPITVKEAIDRGIISKYWSRGYQQYFYCCEYGQKQGLNTGLEALDYYYEVYLPEQRAKKKKEQDEWKHDKSKFTVFKDYKNDQATYWHTLKQQWFTLTLRQFRSDVWDLEEEMGIEPVWLDHIPDIAI